jgi:hypothetical protein
MLWASMASMVNIVSATITTIMPGVRRTPPSPRSNATRAEQARGAA